MAMVSLATGLAAMMFYHQNGTITPFEKLEEEKQKGWIQRANDIITHLDKLNMAVIPVAKKDKKDLSQTSAIERTAKIIRDFVDKIGHKMVKNQRREKPISARLFPEDELATLIYRAVYDPQRK